MVAFVGVSGNPGFDLMFVAKGIAEVNAWTQVIPVL